ncbi:MAG: rhomboid family intramembrane serine protease [Vicinamibacterales bacterium]
MLPVSDVIPPRRTPVVTIALIVVHVAAFLRQLQLDAAPAYLIAGPPVAWPSEPHWPLVLTALFVHEGWVHLAGNLAVLWIFGANVEDELGRWAFLGFYLLSSAIVTLGYLASDPMPGAVLIGSSGAVAAVAGAYFALYPKSQVLTILFAVVYVDLVEVPAIFFLCAWLLVGLLLAIPLSALLTGFTTGAIVGLMMRRHSRRWNEQSA